MKKKLLGMIFLMTVTFFPCLHSSLFAQDIWSIRTGLNFTPGLFYNQTWDPAYNGSAMMLSLSWQNQDFLLEAGSELGYTYYGNYVLFPVQAGLSVFEMQNLRLGAYISFMPGLLLYRPSPYFLMATELNAKLFWTVTPSFNLAVSVGPRYTTSPSYSEEVATLELIDLTVGISAGFILGK